MFNLLPKQEKEAIRREYRIRLAIVILWFSFATLVIASVLLVPSILLSSQKEKAAEQRFDTLSKSIKKDDAAALDSVLRKAQSHLALLSHEAPTVLLHELLVNIVSTKTDSVSLARFSFAKASEGKRYADINGISKDRATLLAFVRALERSGLFEKVEVPISNFAEDTDIEFSIRALGVF